MIKTFDGKKLKQVAKENKVIYMVISHLAKKYGMNLSVSAISTHVAGGASPRAEVVALYAHAFGVPIEYLMKGEFQIERPIEGNPS